MANRTTVTITDMGWEQAQRDFVKLSKIEGIAGIQGKAGSEQIIIAATHEFGTKIAGRNRDITIPKRSYIRSTVIKQQAVYKALVKAMAIAIGQGNDNLVNQLKLIMLKVESDIKKTLTALKTPKLKKATIKARTKRAGGITSDNPLLDTGILRQSITSTVRDRTG